MTDELEQHVEKLVHKWCQFTTSDLSLEFPEVSRMVLYEIVTKKLGYHKFRAKWVLWCGIQKFMSRYDKCLSSEGDYIEKPPMYVANFYT
jgi:hypothetical protein